MADGNNTSASSSASNGGYSAAASGSDVGKSAQAAAIQNQLKVGRTGGYGANTALLTFSFGESRLSTAADVASRDESSLSASQSQAQGLDSAPPGGGSWLWWIVAGLAAVVLFLFARRK